MTSMPRSLLTASACCPRALPACLAQFGLTVLTERISIHGAGSSLALWHARHHCAATNFALALAFTEAIELMALLANRYSLVLD